MKNNNKQVKKKISKLQIAVIISVVFVLIFASLIMYRLFLVKQSVLVEKEIKSLSENPTCAIGVGDNLILGNGLGYVVSIDTNGNVNFSKKIDSKIFGIVFDPKNSRYVVAGIKYHYLDNNFKEIFSIGFDNFIPKEPFASFLNDGTITLVFQSLKDLSYQIIRVDKVGKVLEKDTIPDMGQNSQLSIAPNGNISFILESGDIYLLNGANIVAKTSIPDKQTSSVSNAFTIFTNDGIVAGYKNLIQDPNSKQNVKLPVYFYSNSLSQLKKIEFDSSINGIYYNQNKLVFSTDSGFYFYDTKGNLLNTLPKIDFTPVLYLEGSNAQAYILKNVNSQGTFFFQIILKEPNGREIGRFVRAFVVDNPMFVLTNTSSKLYIIEGVNIKLLQK